MVRLAWMTLDLVRTLRKTMKIKFYGNHYLDIWEWERSDGDANELPGNPCLCRFAFAHQDFGATILRDQDTPG